MKQTLRAVVVALVAAVACTAIGACVHKDASVEACKALNQGPCVSAAQIAAEYRQDATAAEAKYGVQAERTFLVCGRHLGHGVKSGAGGLWFGDEKLGIARCHTSVAEIVSRDWSASEFVVVRTRGAEFRDAKPPELTLSTCDIRSPAMQP